jgi:hypothetical protein
MSSFAERLKKHEAEGRLRDVWGDFTRRVQAELRTGEPENEGMSHGHDTFTGHRATRGRWVNGKSLPRCRACVGALARTLDDQTLLDAWDADGVEHSEHGSGARVATQVANLRPHLKQRLQEQLRAELQQLEFSTRRALHVKVRIAPMTEALHRGEVTTRWKGIVPAKAKIRVAADRQALNAAFADESCLYRDLLHLSETDLATGYEELAAQHPGRAMAELSVRRTRAGKLESLKLARSDTPGYFEFDNDAIEDTEVRLRMAFPFPRQYALYLVQFGSYRVHGVARVSFKLDRAISLAMPKLLVLPPDCETFDDPDDGAVSLELGNEDSLLPTATTAVFYWALS